MRVAFVGLVAIVEHVDISFDNTKLAIGLFFSFWMVCDRNTIREGKQQYRMILYNIIKLVRKQNSVLNQKSSEYFSIESKRASKKTVNLR